MHSVGTTAATRRDAIFNPIVVNTNFLVANFRIDNKAMNSSVIFPTFLYQPKVVALAKRIRRIAADHNISYHLTLTVRKSGIIEEFSPKSHPIGLEIDGWLPLDYFLTAQVKNDNAKTRFFSKKLSHFLLKQRLKGIATQTRSWLGWLLGVARLNFPSSKKTSDQPKAGGFSTDNARTLT